MSENLKKIEKLIEEYEYDRAHKLFLEIYKSNIYNDGFLELYSDFLINMMGMYSEAIEILEQNRKQVNLNTKLQSGFIKSLFYTDQVDRCCDMLEKYKSTVYEDIEIPLIHAKALIKKNSFGATKQILIDFLKDHPGNFEANQLLKQCNKHLEGSITEILDSINAEIEAGNIDKAQQLINKAEAIDITNRQLQKFKNKVKEIENQKKIEQLEEQYKKLEKDKNYTACLDLLKTIKQFDEKNPKIDQRILEIKKFIDKQTFERFLKNANRFFDAGKLNEATDSLFRAMRVNNYKDFFINGNNKNHDFIGFFKFISDFKQNAQNIDLSKVAPYLGDLYATYLSKPQFDQKLLMKLEKFRLNTGDFPFLVDWIEKVQHEVEKEQRFKDSESYEQAVRLFNDEKYESAAIIFKSLDNFKDSKQFLDKIQTELQQQEKLHIMLNEVQRAVDNNEPFLAARRLNDCAAFCKDDSIIKNYSNKIDNLYNKLFQVSPGVPFIGKSIFDTHKAKSGMFHLSDSGLLVYLSKGNFILYDIFNSVDNGIWEFGDLFGAEDDIYRMLAYNNRYFILNLTTGSCFIVNAEPNRQPMILNKFNVSRYIPTNDNDYRVSFAISDDGNNLFFLVSNASGRVKPVFYSYDMINHKINFRETFSFHLFNLISVQNLSGIFGISRMFVKGGKAPMPRFDFAFINERAKVQHGFVFDAVEEPVNSVRKMVYSEKAGKYFFSYDYYDPYTGQFSSESIGLGILTFEKNVFFQESRMEDKLSERKFMAGDFSLYEEKEKIILPWSDHDRNIGIAVFPWLDPAKPVEEKFGKGDYVNRILCKDDSIYLLAWDKELDSYKILSRKF